jgi:hypothetical protein
MNILRVSKDRVQGVALLTPWEGVEYLMADEFIGRVSAFCAERLCEITYLQRRRTSRMSKRGNRPARVMWVTLVGWDYNGLCIA